MAILNRTTKQWQEIDSAHQLHPFTDFKSLAEEGSIIISKANGVHLTNSDGKQLLDAMSGLWCVNIGYGRKSMAEVAYEQMQELPYYNSFFKTETNRYTSSKEVYSGTGAHRITSGSRQSVII